MPTALTIIYLRTRVATSQPKVNAAFVAEIFREGEQETPDTHDDQ